ncbi:MAG TPA: hypothetical protein GXX29_03300 [Firmicutes bacterium]|nr:hypothetical protein [Bacillota bacterium]
MKRRLAQVAAAVVVVAVVALWNFSVAFAESDLLAHCRELIKDGKYEEMLAIAEAELAREPLQYTYPSPATTIIRHMVDAYRKTGRTAEGVDFLFGIYARDAGQRAASLLGEMVFELALESAKYRTAKEVLDILSGGETAPEWSLQYAQLYAVTGRKEEALLKLQENFGWPYGASRTAVIGLPEFVALHDDPTFQELVTERPSTFAERIERSAALLRTTVDIMTEAELEEVASFYKSIDSAAKAAAMWQEISAVDARLYNQADRYKDKLMQMLSAGADWLFYQMSLAKILLMTDDGDMAVRVVEVMAGKDLRPFPEQLIMLAFLTARISPATALPFLHQVLDINFGEEAALSQSYLQFMLVNAFAVAQPDTVDLLLGAAVGDEAVRRDNALALLVFFQEEKLIPILLAKMERSESQEAWLENATHLSHLRLPEARQALVRLQYDTALAPAVREELPKLIEECGPPANPFGDEGVKITNPTLKKILLNNLELTLGYDIGKVAGTLALSADEGDIEQLQRIRSRLMTRLSDEAWYDYRVVTAVINLIKWRE